MKKWLTFVCFLSVAFLCRAQEKGAVVKTDDSKEHKAQDHFVIGYNFDNLRFHDNDQTGFATKWYSRGFHASLMYDKPIKKSNFGIGVGVGVSSSNIYHNSSFVSDSSGILIDSIPGFNSTAKTYKLNKLSTSWAEIPVEIRWRSNPDQYKNSWKIALGAKVGFRMSAAQKTTLNTGVEIQSIKTKRFTDLMTYRLGPTLRMGYGPVNLQMFYSLTDVIKKDRGMKLTPFSIGVSINAF